MEQGITGKVEKWRTDTLIEELNLLWEPVRPYLARQIEESMVAGTGRSSKSAPFRVSYLLSLRRRSARIF